MCLTKPTPPFLFFVPFLFSAWAGRFCTSPILKYLKHYLNDRTSHPTSFCEVPLPSYFSPFQSTPFLRDFIWFVPPSLLQAPQCAPVSCSYLTVFALFDFEAVSQRIDCHDGWFPDEQSVPFKVLQHTIFAIWTKTTFDSPFLIFWKCQVFFFPSSPFHLNGMYVVTLCYSSTREGRYNPLP